MTLHVLWVVLQAADKLCNGVLLEADLMDSGEQREPTDGQSSYINQKEINYSHDR